MCVLNARNALSKSTITEGKFLPFVRLFDIEDESVELHKSDQIQSRKPLPLR